MFFYFFSKNYHTIEYESSPYEEFKLMFSHAGYKPFAIHIVLNLINNK